MIIISAHKHNLALVLAREWAFCFLWPTYDLCNISPLSFYFSYKHHLKYILRVQPRQKWAIVHLAWWAIISNCHFTTSWERKGWEMSQWERAFASLADPCLSLSIHICCSQLLQLHLCGIPHPLLNATNTCIYMDALMCTCTQTHTHTEVHTHIYTYTYSVSHTETHAHKDIHTQKDTHIYLNNTYKLLS